MATQTVEFAASTGLTLTAKLFSAGSDTVVASQSATEATNRKGVYSVAYTDVAAGTYKLIALSGSTPVCQWWVVLTLSTATFQSYEFIASTPTNVSDVQTAILAKLPAALVGGKMSSDAVALGGSTTAASNIALSGAVIGVATVAAGASTTSIPTSACTPSGGAENQFRSRIIIFTSATTTVALRGQATEITASSNASNPTFTVTVLTTSPVSGDTFIIV